MIEIKIVYVKINSNQIIYKIKISNPKKNKTKKNTSITFKIINKI